MKTIAGEAFRGKTQVSPDKVRGGYYTPAPIARFLAEWVRQAGPRVLEPSCGDGRVDLLLRANEIEKALDLVDGRVLIEAMGLSPQVVADCRAAWTVLRDRRIKRRSR